MLTGGNPTAYRSITDTVNNSSGPFVAVMSTSGGPIQFGFYRANGTANTGYTLVAGIDNWQMTVFPAAAPPPAPIQRDIPTLGGTGLILIALLLALVGGVFLRRSR